MSGNVKVDDSIWREIRQRIHEMGRGDPHVRIGLVGSAATETDERSGIDMATLGAIHEFGTAHVPERSWLRRTFAEKRDVIVPLIAQLAGAIVGDKISIGTALGLLGAKMAAEAKKTITGGEPIPPPNAPATIAAKGSSRPLYNTGQMVGAITWEVRNAGGES